MQCVLNLLHRATVGLSICIMRSCILAASLVPVYDATDVSAADFWCHCCRLQMPLMSPQCRVFMPLMLMQQTFDVSAADFWCLCSRLLMNHQMFLSAFLSLVIFQGGLCWDHHMQTEIFRDHACCAPSASLWCYCTLWMPCHSFWCHIPGGLCWDHYMQTQIYRDHACCAPL